MLAATHKASSHNQFFPEFTDRSVVPERYKYALRTVVSKPEINREFSDLVREFSKSFRNSSVNSSMKFIISHLEQLLSQLSKSTKHDPDHYGCERMTEMINQKMKPGIKDRYLYETLILGVAKAKSKKVTKINLQPHNINTLAKFLGYEAYEDYVAVIENPMPSVLRKCTGTYRCYLRRNTRKGVILCSPLEISEFENQVRWLLKGPHQDYKGEVTLKNNCLFVLMKGNNGKQFHHVYHIGQREQPKVLQGVFSGVSTSFEPIGGRVVLVRTEDKLESLRVFSKEVSTLRKSKLLEERRIAEYFNEYSSNNLSLKKSMTFGLDDLGDCK